MQDKITKILKQASIFTTDPDKDWRRIFVGLIVITVSVSVWSFFFYRQVNQDIQVSETKRPKNAGAVVAERSTITALWKLSEEVGGRAIILTFCEEPEARAAREEAQARSRV
jgi:hypothetical protein